MDEETAVKLNRWIESSKSHPDFKCDPTKDHTFWPISFEKLSTQYIKIQKIEFTSCDSDIDIYTRFRNFQKILSSEDNCQIFASFESIITSTDYGLILDRIKTSLVTWKLFYKDQPKDKPQVTLGITINPGQSILEILEILLIPNLTLVDSFEFFIPTNKPDIHLGLWLIVDSMRKSNLSNFKVKLQNAQPSPDTSSPSTIIKTVTYPPTLAIVLDDGDIFSSVDRLLDMLISLPIAHRKVDIWIQQSVKAKFASQFEKKIAKLWSLSDYIHILKTNAINPILIPTDNVDGNYIKLLTFRKVDELIGLIKRYQMIHSTSLWTSNISSAYEITKDITNCQLFTINTINDCPSLAIYTFLNYTNISYKFSGGLTFQNCIPMVSFAPLIEDVNLEKIPSQGNKNFLALEIEDRANVLASILSKNEKCTPAAINLIQTAQLNHSNFKTINKCLMLRQFVPIGIISVHFDKIESIPDQSLIFGLLAAILLYGNCCLIITHELPETFKQFIDQFNLIYPSSISIGSPTSRKLRVKSTIPYGWINKESQIVGLSFGLHQLTRLINFDDCTKLFGRVRSLYFPVADQLSLTNSSQSGY